MRTTWSSECRLEWIVSFVAPAERQVRLWRSADRTETGAQRAVRDVLRAVPEPAWDVVGSAFAHRRFRTGADRRLIAHPAGRRSGRAGTRDFRRPHILEEFTA